jgi:hypothetical protein
MKPVYQTTFGGPGDGQNERRRKNGLVLQSHSK